MGIDSPETLSAWAQEHGLLGVFIRYTPQRAYSPIKAHWQVIWPGRHTTPVVESDPPWRRGIQTFFCGSIHEKDRMEERAKTWASGKYDVDEWVRVEGLGGLLISNVLAAELKRFLPSTKPIYRKRQYHPQRRTG